MPRRIMALAMEAIAFIRRQPDPAKPDPYPRDIHWVRGGFAHATVT